MTHRLPSGGAAIPAEALLAGLLFGLTAQLFRQVDGPLMVLGAATAPWVTIGFAVAVWATRRSHSVRNASLIGAAVMAAYLLAWLLSYHVLFAVRESVGLFAAWREAAPWLVIAGPACLLLGLAAAFSHRKGILGDACLASPIAWSLPEVIDSSKEGWSPDASPALLIAALAVVPMIAAARRDVRPVTVVLASVPLGGLAIALSTVVSSQIPS